VVNGLRKSRLSLVPSSRFAASHVHLLCAQQHGSVGAILKTVNLHQLADTIEMIGQHSRDSLRVSLNGIIELLHHLCMSGRRDLHTLYINVIEYNGTEVYQ
jgi:hypothetical protein